MRKRQFILLMLAVVTTAVFLVGCPQSTKPRASSPSPSSTPTPTTATKTEQPVAPERNPPGDIPDTQAFILYKNAAGGYAVEVPEGWARTEQGTDATFVSKFDGERVTLSKSAAPPTVASVQQTQVPALQKQGRAVKIQGVKTTKMPRTGNVVYVTYTANSAPDPVTNKQLRLDNVTYYYYRNGKLAALTVWAPTGADNVDQWKRISESFRWL